MPDHKIDETTDIRAHVARLPAHAAEAAVREWNARILPDVEARRAQREAERERYILSRGLELFDAWMADQRRRCATEAAAEFDRARPPLPKIERIELAEALALAKGPRKAGAR